jgi:hypothetical protein
MRDPVRCIEPHPMVKPAARGFYDGAALPVPQRISSNFMSSLDCKTGR